MNENLLPLGSIVYLEEGNVKLMIAGRGIIFDNEGKNGYVDYMGVEYPQGIDPKNVIYFNHENIDRVIFRGYKDEEEQRYLEVFQKLRNNNKIPKIKA